MEIKDILALRRLSFGVLSLTAAFVFAFGGFIFFSLFSTNPYAAAIARPEVARSQAVSEFELQDRGPASVVAAIGGGARTLDLGCVIQSEQQSIQVQSSQLRIRTKVCGYDLDLKTSEIVNTSNGYRSAIFKTSEKTISSDYIQLNPGLNQIQIQARDRQGTLRSSELLVSRLSEF